MPEPLTPPTPWPDPLDQAARTIAVADTVAHGVIWLSDAKRIRDEAVGEANETVDQLRASLSDVRNDLATVLRVITEETGEHLSNEESLETAVAGALSVLTEDIGKGLDDTEWTLIVLALREQSDRRVALGYDHDGMRSASLADRIEAT